ncbi:MAG TPA: glycogen-binding domain-containing protein [Deltaproteobacteria bacterium]|nr:glycogen-binding domain-containing protein [Deltaproteobacteria bacterium]
MSDELISLYIDDELDLDGKIAFVELIHDQTPFKDRTVEFLRSEKTLRAEVTDRVPEVTRPRPLTYPFRGRGLLYSAAAAAAVAAAVLAVMFWPAQKTFEQGPAPESHRFVIYDPGTSSAEIAGDFTGWERVPMERAGTNGYWEISLGLRPGEHRYVFILDGHQRVADPTVMVKEQDDFGGENTILVTGVRT